MEQVIDSPLVGFVGSVVKITKRKASAAIIADRNADNTLASQCLLTKCVMQR